MGENYSQRISSAYATNPQPRIPTQVCQGRVVTTDLPTLGTNPNSKQQGSTTQETNDLGNLRRTKRTVLDDREDGPRGLGGRSTG
jgi:hypothetical protein